MVEECEHYYDAFYEACLQEYSSQPKVFAKYPLDELVELAKTEYIINKGGYFERVSQVQPTEMRAEADLSAVALADFDA